MIPVALLLRQEAFLLCGLLYVLLGSALLARLLRARRHGLSIRMQVFLALMSTTVAITTAFSVIVVDRFTARAVSFAQKGAEDEAALVGNLALGAMDTMNLSLEKAAALLQRTQVLDGLGGLDQGVRIQVVDSRGKVVVDSSTEGKRGEDLSGRPEVAIALTGGKDDIARILQDGRVAAAVGIRHGERVVGAVRVEKAIVGMTQLMDDIAPKVALLAAILGLGAAASALVIGHAVGGPIEKLTEAALLIAQGQKQGALPLPRGREVRGLTEAFQAMRRELEQKNQVESLAQDLSHEIKNPIAAIRASAEVLAEAAGDEEAVRRFSIHIDAAASRLQTLVTDLLAMARLEARGIASTREKVDLREVAAAALEMASPLAEQRQVILRLSGTESAWVRGDPHWLRRAMDNLLANAVAWSPPHGEVRVEVTVEGAMVEVMVKDSGPGVPEAIRGRLFERFVTSRPDRGGSGLGLALVRAVAESHGGRAVLRETGEAGSRFVLQIPKG